MKTLLLVAMALIPYASFATDLPANNCEIFVDQVGGWSESHGYRGITTYVKTLNSRLDGSIKKVVFRSRLQADEAVREFCNKHASPGSSTDCEKVEIWIDRPAEPFFAQDFFKVELVLTHDYTFEHVYEGAFYVETDKGTRYWLNPAGGGNFFLDEQSRSDMIRAGSGGYFRGHKRINTADSYPYLNPNRCR